MSRQIRNMVDDAAARAERLHQGEAGELRVVLLRRLLYSGGVRYVIACFAVIILMSIYKPAK